MVVLYYYLRHKYRLYFLPFQSGKQQWSIDIVEPASDLIIDHPNTVLQILKLVTFVGNIETEAPIIVISRYVIERIMKTSV